MFELDCESGSSAIKSLSIGFSCTEQMLCNALLSIDIEQIYENEWDSLDIPSEQYLYNYIVDTFGDHKPLTSVFWFHLTRTTEENEFKDGVFPLGQSLDHVWDTMLSLAKDDEIRRNLSSMRHSGVNNYHYSAKHNDPIHWGPYAILVKVVANHSVELAQHDYLAMPEIIEDICNGYESQFGESIIENYEKKLVPKVVKFRSGKEVDIGCIEAALCYAYSFVRDLPPNGGAIYCFDGEGVVVGYSDIESVSKV